MQRRLRKSELADVLCADLERGGLRVTRAVLSGPRGDLPLSLDITMPMYTRRYQVFIWNVSHGGKSRPADEYRIQAKLRCDNHLRYAEGTPLLMGFYDEDNAACDPEPFIVYVAWDPLKHLRLGKSSSCQVKRQLMERGFYLGAAEAMRSLAD